MAIPIHWSKEEGDGDIVGIKDKTINQHPRDVAMRADAAEVGCDESRI